MPSEPISLLTFGLWVLAQEHAREAQACHATVLIRYSLEFPVWRSHLAFLSWHPLHKRAKQRHASIETLNYRENR